MPPDTTGRIHPSPTEGITEMLFRGPDGATGATREITLRHDDYKDDKKHRWLEIEKK